MITAKVTIEGGDLISPDFEKLIMGAIDDTLLLVDKDFNDTFRTFRHKPTMHIEKATKKGNTIEGSEWTDDVNYVRLNNGVPPHQVGVGGKYMSFRPVYTRKTSRGVISSRSGGKSGRRQRAKGPWTHPGIHARNFDVAILNKRIKDFDKNIDKALELATK